MDPGLGVQGLDFGV